jgi:DNA-binding YbaB/EbfC family protein
MAGQDDLSRMLAQVQRLQSDMVQAQRSLADERVEGTAGGGVVRAVCDGQGTLLQVAIDPSVVDPDDVEMLQDLVVAAVNDAARKAQAVQGQTMGSVTGGLSGLLPGLGGPDGLDGVGLG